jgi:predicted transcriptional regulator
MQTAILKKEVFELLNNADDSILLQVKSILLPESVFEKWDELPSKLKNNILVGKRQIEEGKFVTEEKMMAKYRSWIGK